MTHRGPFQPQTFCDSVILYLVVIRAVRVSSKTAYFKCVHTANPMNHVYAPHSHIKMMVPCPHGKVWELFSLACFWQVSSSPAVPGFQQNQGKCNSSYAQNPLDKKDFTDLGAQGKDWNAVHRVKRHISPWQNTHF